MVTRHTFTPEECSQGGSATYARHGGEHYRRAALKGVERIKQADPERWSRIGRAGNRAKAARRAAGL